ncbi:MAG: hypothetical protein RJB61_1728 [Actinomycetota bacterium]|jgi:cation transport ATPase
MVRVQADDPQRATWAASGLIAAGWSTALTTASIVLIYLEETYITTNPAYRAVMVVVVTSFVASPFAAGAVHRSRRVRLLVALLGTAGLLVSLAYGSWAYSSIGGGP